MWLLWLLVTVIASTAVVYVAFLALCGARLIQSKGVELPPDMRLVAHLFIAIGFVADVAFNWTRGALMFREFKGTTFSSHIQWRVDNGRWDQATQEWVRLLNAGEPGHIKRVPA
jgi:hypothetical protein